MAAPPKTRNAKSKRKPPTKTAIQRVLRAAAFDPREVGALSIIADVGDAKYFLVRAKEAITEAEAGINPHFNLQNALGLIALASVTDAN